MWINRPSNSLISTHLQLNLFIITQYSVWLIVFLAQSYINLKETQSSISLWQYSAIMSSKIQYNMVKLVTKHFLYTVCAWLHLN